MLSPAGMTCSDHTCMTHLACMYITMGCGCDECRAAVTTHLELLHPRVHRMDLVNDGRVAVTHLCLESQYQIEADEWIEVDLAGQPTRDRRSSTP